MRRDIWKPRDPFKPDTPPNWLNIPVGGSAETAGTAIMDFVERHQWQKLYKHVRRGNLNGLPNFLEFSGPSTGFSSLIITGHGSAGAVIPFGFVTKGVMTNLELLIGPFELTQMSTRGTGSSLPLKKI